MLMNLQTATGGGSRGRLSLRAYLRASIKEGGEARAKQFDQDEVSGQVQFMGVLATEICLLNLFKLNTDGEAREVTACE